MVKMARVSGAANFLQHGETERLWGKSTARTVDLYMSSWIGHRSSTIRRLSALNQSREAEHLSKGLLCCKPFSSIETGQGTEDTANQHTNPHMHLKTETYALLNKGDAENACVGAKQKGDGRSGADLFR